MTAFGPFFGILGIFPSKDIESFTFYCIATNFIYMCLRINNKNLGTRPFQRCYWSTKIHEERLFDHFWPFFDIFVRIFILRHRILLFLHNYLLHHQMTFSKGYSDQRSSAAAWRRSSCGAKGRKCAEERISVVMTISWALMTFQWALITFSPEVAVRYALVYTIFVTIAL